MKRTVLVTGATQGLGAAMVRALDERTDFEVVLAVRDVGRGEAVAKTLRRPARVVALDLSSLENVRRFAAGWNEPLFGLVNNAGVQHATDTAPTVDGYDETFAVNWLAVVELTLALLPQLEGGRVVNIGSGTHNPENKTATLFGFRGGRFTSVPALARGETDGTSPGQRAKDRYATSKLVVTAGTAALARRFPKTTFLTLDPGLMAGTGLARGAPLVQRLAWSSVLKWVAPLLPDTSTPERSALAAVGLLTGEFTSGGVYDFEQQPSRRLWKGALDVDLQERIAQQTFSLLGVSP
jgi:NAD(P)-dependent dehydrogenase (short-subunit alcohol dehydrogenase family)